MFQKSIPVLLILSLWSCGEPTKLPQVTEAPAQVTTFVHFSPEPVNGWKEGVIELGGSGFNSFIIEIDSADRWKLVESRFGESKVYENAISQKETETQLKDYINNMINSGVKSTNIHFVQSSTASTNKKVQQINEALLSIGYQVNNVSVDVEGKLSFYATMPLSYQDEAFVIDLGSGNTKISWLENGELRSLSTYGAKYFMDSIADTSVYRQVRALVKNIPVQQRKKCFMIGGVPYNLAKMEDGFRERYSVLKPAASYVAEDDKTRAGLNIYQAVIDEATQCEQFIFDWNSNFTIGFLIRK